MPLSSSPHFQGHSPPCLGCFIIYNCSTSKTSIKHLMSATAFFCIQVVSCVTTMTTHLEKSSFWRTLGKTTSFLLLLRRPLFLDNRKLVCCLGTWTSGVNTKFNLVLLTNQQFQEQVGWISLPWNRECKECPRWEILGFELSWCSVTGKCPVFLQHNLNRSNSRRQQMSWEFQTDIGSRIIPVCIWPGVDSYCVVERCSQDLDKCGSHSRTLRTPSMMVIQVISLTLK